MSKEKTLSGSPARSSSHGGAAGSVLSELFHVGLYKPMQGKAVRQVTFAALAVFVALACYRLYVQLSVGSWSQLQYPVPLALLVVGLWICYRVVNIPRFADFLIAVQAEMKKVSWPTQQELIRSSLVVIFVIFLLAVVLFGFDLVWTWLFQAIGVLEH